MINGLPAAQSRSNIPRGPRTAGLAPRLPARATAAEPRIRRPHRPRVSHCAAKAIRWRCGARAEACELVRARADRLLNQFEVARVAADPPRATDDGAPGGWPGLAYFRLHGSPRIYYSSYDDGYLDALAARLQQLRRARIPTWCIFDNTTLGAATTNALSLLQCLK